MGKILPLRSRPRTFSAIGLAFSSLRDQLTGGLGFYTVFASGMFDVTGVFAGIVVLAVLAIIINEGVKLSGQKPGHLWQSLAEVRRSQPDFALRATSRSPSAIPPRAFARGGMAKANGDRKAKSYEGPVPVISLSGPGGDIKGC